MKINRKKIKDVKIPQKKMDEMLTMLKEELEDVETELEDKTVYAIINNIIKERYLANNGYMKLDSSFLGELTKEIIAGEVDQLLIEMCYEHFFVS